MLVSSAYNFSGTESAKTYAAAADISAQADVEEDQSLQTDTAQPYNTGELRPDMNTNLDVQNYDVWGGIIGSYLVAEDGGYMRVQAIKQKTEGTDEENAMLVAEYYDEQFALQSQQYIDDNENELSFFLGFYAGSDYYYVAWGQPVKGGQTLESLDETFMRVIKYDKEWKIQDYVDLTSRNCHLYHETGGDIVLDWIGVDTPAFYGSLRMTEYGGHLYINTCRQMINGHQTSMMMDIVEKDMSIVQANHELTDYYASVSHSFNQFLLIDDTMQPTRMVTLNHGDGGEDRGAALGQYELYTEYPSVTDSTYVKEVNTFPCIPSWDSEHEVNNYTGISLGGLERSQTSYLIAGNSIDQVEETFLTAQQRNIFVTTTSRTSLNKENTEVHWFTDYKEGDNVKISTPQITKMNDNLFVVMWREGTYREHVQGTLAYVLIDGNGNKLGEVKKVGAEITDCKPVVKDKKAVWYSSSSHEGVYFYTIDEQGNFVRHGVNTIDNIPKLNQVVLQKKDMSEGAVRFEWEPVEGAVGYYIVVHGRWLDSSSRVNTETFYVEGGSTSSYLLNSTKVLSGWAYDFSICSANDKDIMSYGSNIINQMIFQGLYSSDITVENVEEGVKVQWSPRYNGAGATEYRVYRSSADGTDDVLIATTGAAAKWEPGADNHAYIIDKTAESGKAYDYSVSVCKGELESEHFFKKSIIRLSTPKVRAECLYDNAIKLTWDAVPGAKSKKNDGAPGYEGYVREWDESQGKWVSSNKQLQWTDDELSCTINGLNDGKKYQFTVYAISKSIQTSSMQNNQPFYSGDAVIEMEYIRPEAPPPTPTPTTTPTSKPTTTPTTTPTSKPTATPTSKPTPTPTSTPTTTPTSKPTPTPVKLSAPQVYPAVNTVDGIEFKWKQVEGAASYYVYWYDEEHPESVHKVNRSILSFLHESPEEGKTYCYYVVAWTTKDGEFYQSEPSMTVRIQYKNPSAAAHLKAPVLTSLSCLVDGAVQVEWEPVEGADGYKIYSYNIESPNYTKVFTVEGENQNHFLQNFAEPEGVYCFYVRPYKWTVAGGQQPDVGKKSGEKEITIQRARVKLTSVKNTFSGVEIKWEPIFGVDGYEICYHRSDSEVEYSQLVEGSDTAVFVDKKSENGVSYYFYVKPYINYENWRKEGKASEKVLITVSKMTTGETPSPEPGGSTPKPGDTTPEPGGSTPKPGDTTPGPGGSTPKPGDTTPAPGGSTPKPGDTTPAPGGSTPKPGDTTPAPGENTTKPGETPTVPGESLTNDVMKGDVTGDKKVNLMDAKEVLKYSLGIIKVPSELARKAADVNEDNKVDLNDAKNVLKYSLGIINQFSGDK